MTLSVEVKTYVIVSFDGSFKYITTKQYKTLKFAIKKHAFN